MVLKVQKIRKLILFVFAFSPIIASADITISSVIGKIKSEILGPLVPVLVALALVVFIWGVIKYITAGGDEEKRKKGGDTMMFGIVALFVMVAVWGLVAVLINTFFAGEDISAPPDIPGLPEPQPD